MGNIKVNKVVRAWRDNQNPSCDQCMTSLKLFMVTLLKSTNNETCKEVANLVLKSSRRFLSYFFDRFVVKGDSFSFEREKAWKLRIAEAQHLINVGNKATVEDYLTVYKVRDTRGVDMVEYDYDHFKYYPKHDSLLVTIVNTSYEVVDIYSNMNLSTHEKVKMQEFSGIMTAIVKALLLMDSDFTLTQWERDICMKMLKQFESVMKVYLFLDTTPAMKKEFVEKQLAIICPLEYPDKQTYQIDQVSGAIVKDSRRLIDILHDEELMSKGLIPEGSVMIQENQVTQLPIEKVWRYMIRSIRRRELKKAFPWYEYTSSIVKMEQKFGSIRDGKSPYTAADLFVSSKSSPSIKSIPDYLWYDEVCINPKTGRKEVRRKPPRASYIKSVFEGHSDCLLFDKWADMVGYAYKYGKVGEESICNKDLQVKNHIILCIDNPGKLKPRLIHLFCNSTADLLNYFMRRSDYRHNRDPLMCTKDHKIGRDRLVMFTSTSFREAHPDASMFLADWSDATDVAPQDLQKDVIACKYGDACAEAWMEVMREPFYVIGVTGVDSNIAHKQTRGQGQGGPDSFHEFSDLSENLYALAQYLFDMYRGIVDDDYHANMANSTILVGDDSIKVSLNDPDCLLFSFYCAVCYWAGIPINISKSTVLKASDKIWHGEFAKVDVADGKYFSAVPPRLLFSLSDQQGSKWFACMDWCIQYGYSEMKPHFEDIIRERFPLAGESIIRILNSDMSPGLRHWTGNVTRPECFEDTQLSIDELMLYTSLHLRGCICKAVMSDKLTITKDYISDPFKMIEGVFYSREQMDYVLEQVNSKHKIFHILQGSEDVCKYLSYICCDNIDDLLYYTNNPVYGALRESLGITRNEEELLSTFSEMYQAFLRKDLSNYYDANRIWEICTEILNAKSLRINERSPRRRSGVLGNLFQTYEDKAHLIGA